MTVVLRVIQGLRQTRPSLDQALELSAEIWEVMDSESCWARDPAERPSVDRLAERLSSIHPTELTTSRIKMQKPEGEQDTEVDVPTPSSFRAAMRDQNAGFSKAEIEILQEHVRDSTQPTLDPNNLRPSSNDSGLNTHGFLDATAVQMEIGPELGTRKSQEVLEALSQVSPVTGSAGQDTSPESGGANEVLVGGGYTSESPPKPVLFSRSFKNEVDRLNLKGSVVGTIMALTLSDLEDRI